MCCVINILTCPTWFKVSILVTTGGILKRSNSRSVWKLSRENYVIENIHTKTKSQCFHYFSSGLIEQRFRKAPISLRIRTDGRPDGIKKKPCIFKFPWPSVKAALISGSSPRSAREVQWSSHVLAWRVPSQCLSVNTQCNLANIFIPSNRKSNMFTAIMLSKTQWIVSHKIPLKIRQQTSLQIGQL